MPPNVRRALAPPRPRSSLLRDIKHVVILTQESRSFDHHFGRLAGVRGSLDPEAMKLARGLRVPPAESLPGGH